MRTKLIDHHIYFYIDFVIDSLNEIKHSPQKVGLNTDLLKVSKPNLIKLKKFIRTAVDLLWNASNDLTNCPSE